MTRTSALQIVALPDIPLVEPGDDLANLIADGIALAGLEPETQDVVVIAQKVVSKSEGRSVDLATVTPSNSR